MVEPPVPYQVSYTELVRQRLQELGDEATQRGDGPQFAAALEEFQRRLRLYPQFGDPLLDLTTEPGQIYTGIIRPLFLRYAVYEDRRLVLIGALPVLLPMLSPDPDVEE